MKSATQRQWSSPVYVVGAGSVGAFLAARLAGAAQALAGESGSAAVTLVGHREHLPRSCRIELIPSGREKGQQVEVPYLSWSEISRFPKGSLILVATKVFQLKESVPLMVERLPKGHLCTWVFLQNGLGVVEEVQGILRDLGVDRFPHPHATPALGRAICWFGSRLERREESDSGARVDLKVRVAGIDAVEIAGSAEKEGALREFARWLEASSIPVRWIPGGVKQAEWRKALWNVTTNGLCALAQAPNGAGADDPLLRPLAEGLLEEAMAVARAEGVPLTSVDRDRVFESIQKTATNLNSTFQDLSAGRRTEMPWLNGAVVQRGEAHGVPVPMNRFVSHLVQFLERKGTGREGPARGGNTAGENSS